MIRMTKISVLRCFSGMAIVTALLIVIGSITTCASPDPGKVKNIPPTIDLNITPAKKPVDIVIMTDYTGTKLTALNTQISALKAQFNAVNVDPVFHIISDVKVVGTQNDELYNFYRNARYNYQVNYYKTYTHASSWNYYHQYWKYEEVQWESTQALKSQFSELPVRNPQNITFTRSALKYYNTSSITRQYYDVTIRCTNDIKTSSEIIPVDKKFVSDNSGAEREFDYIMNENATIDKQWTMGGKISNVSYSIYSLDYAKLNAVPLRTNSERHLIFLSDASEKDYGKSLGNCFSFGDMTDTLKSYIKANNFSLYGVVPDITRQRTLQADKVSEIIPLGDSTLFYMENGSLLKLGNSQLAVILAYGEKMYPEKFESPGSIKEKIVTNMRTYLWMQDGTIKYYDTAANAFKTLEGITNATKVCNFDNNGDLYVLNGSGKIFYVYRYDMAVTPYNNSIVITDIFRIEGTQNIYITAAGEPYMEYRTYNNYTRVSTERLLTRAKIIDGSNVLRNLPNIKDSTYFYSGAPTNYHTRKPTIVLYNTGQIQQFPYLYSTSTTSGYLTTYNYYLKEDPSVSVLETGVASLEGAKVCAFYYKSDGTVKMLNSNYVSGTYEKDDDIRTGMLPYLNNTALSVPLTGITMTYASKYTDKYFLKDANGITYLYDGTYMGSAPVIGTTLKSMGTGVKKIVEYSTGSNFYFYVLYNNGQVRELGFYRTYNSGYSNYVLPTNTLLPETEAKDIFSFYNSVYLLKEDGSVLGKGNSNYGQIGTKSNGYINSFVSPFATTLTFDTTKTYLSLLDIFNTAAGGVFYPVGEYAAALNDIYNKYSSYSTGGNTYVVLGENVKYDSVYNDYEKDPEYTRKWSIAHDPYYFDNSMGLSVYHNPSGFAMNPPVKLDKVGKYTVNLYARDNPKVNNLFDNYRLWSLGNHNLTVYIHRKPIALMRAEITNNGNGTFTVKALDAGSYDPDHSNSRTDKGIAAREWRWREFTSTLWTSGAMTKSDCDPKKAYIIQLRVKDIEGAWSDYATVTIDKSNPPVALFRLDKTIIGDKEALKVKDQSFSQSFSEIEKWHWVVKKLNADGSVPTTNLQNAQFTSSNAGTGTMAGCDANVKTSYTANGAGTYRVYLRVKDSNGLWSDKGTDSTTPVDLSKYYSMDFVVDKPPIASFTIEKNPIEPTDILMLKDTSISAGVSPINRWHWIVKSLDEDGKPLLSSLQDSQHETCNAGTGILEGYDDNVKTDYSANGTGSYRIYLRVRNANGMWSDGGTDNSINLDSFFYKDLEVEESFKIADFRIVKVKDLHLESYYYIPATGQYDDRPMGVNAMAVDRHNFGGMVDGLTKGYLFEFEIDTVNFNEDADMIIIMPHFFTCDNYRRDAEERDLFWENSYHEILKTGAGGHADWTSIKLDKRNRTITGEDKATWRGSYLIPGTAWAVPRGTAAADAALKRLNRDIIVNFEIKGYKDGELKYDYNLKQWAEERTVEKGFYEIGDVIRYSHWKTNLEDNNVILNRP